MNVCFRKFEDGDVVALFPTAPEGLGRITSYMHIGQHAPADARLLFYLKPASEPEYRALLAELKQVYRDETLIVN